jgi:hypothetical protein
VGAGWSKDFAIAMCIEMPSYGNATNGQERGHLFCYRFFNGYIPAAPVGRRDTPGISDENFRNHEYDGASGKCIAITLFFCSDCAKMTRASLHRSERLTDVNAREGLVYR